MQLTSTIQGRATRAPRRQARRAHAVARPNPTQPRSLRARVATAFRQMAHGAAAGAAWANTIAFYRSGGQAWTQRLG